MNYKRNLSDLKSIEKNKYNVFSCFSCGGGSSMGYKNAGYNMVGTCEIDKQMDSIYRKNFGDTHNFLMGVQDFKNLDNDKIPKELFQLDILDGSSPCSTFSTAGSREKSRGKDKVFREGQAKQVLSDLFFDFIDVANKLKPKIIVAENVSGMLKGNAKGYVKMIIERLNQIGYTTQLFLLNGATMGLPQKRERVFFISHKKEYDLPKLKLEFDEKPITFGEIMVDEGEPYQRPLRGKSLQIRGYKKLGDSNLQNACFRLEGKNNFFGLGLLYKDKTPGTIIGNDTNCLYDTPRHMNKVELCLAGSYPLDYDFGDIKPEYLIGMSVPPLMMYKVSNEIKNQWLDKIYI